MHSFHLIRVIFLILIFNITQAQNETFTMKQIGSNHLLEQPWDLNYGPDGYLWITEKVAGNVVRVNPTTGGRDELIHLSDIAISGGQDGLLGMALDDELLTNNPYVYLSYTHLVLGTRKQKLVRYTYTINGNDGTLSSPLVLIDNLPAYIDHNSGRLIFGPDKKLYYTIGDQAVKDCASNLAQFLPNQQEIDQKNWANYPGKVLRLNTDGSIPVDNPVLNGVKSHIYSYGHRNPQGLVFGKNGLLYSDEHGPSADDEVNIINSGKNYGWPYISGIKDNLQYDSDGCLLNNETLFVASNYQDPLTSMFVPNTYKDPTCIDTWMCRPNIAPSSIGIYESDAIPSWKNSLLVTSLKKGRIYRLKLNTDGTAVEQNNITQYFYTQNRYRDIVVSPDGKTFYIITDTSGKTSDSSGKTTVSTMQNPGAILKFTLNENLSIAKMEKESFFRVYQNPSKKEIYIEKTSNCFPTEVTIFDTNGKFVATQKTENMQKNTINTGSLTTGLYIMTIIDDTNSTSTHKLLIE